MKIFVTSYLIINTLSPAKLRGFLFVWWWVDLGMNRIILIGFINSLLFTQSNEFMKGVDLSMLKQVEDNGGLFYDNVNQIDPIQ